MADLSPAELAKLDQIHANIMSKMAQLVSSAIDGIAAEGEVVVASKLAAEAEKTDRKSAAAITAASLIRNARYAIADEKRKADRAELIALLAEYVDDEPCWLDHHGYCQNHGLSDTSGGVDCRNVRAHRLIGTKPQETP